MKRTEEIRRLTRCYEHALCAYIRKGTEADAEPAVQLGRRAASLGLETLDIAKVHERALCAAFPSQESVQARKTMTALAQHFFSETLVPIERNHPAARHAEGRVQELTRTLQQRQRETAASKRKLKQGIARRQSAEAASRDVLLDRTRLLKESHKLQRRLRYRLRKLIVIQERDRQKHSHEFRDEIAQTLLALDIRLLALKEAGMAGMKILSEEIAETQSVVIQSHKTFTRLAHDSKNSK